MSRDNPFGSEADDAPSRINPFGDEPPAEGADDAAARVAEAARRIRMLRTQMGAEGLTMSGTRSLIEELSAALDSTARALRVLAERGAP